MSGPEQPDPEIRTGPKGFVLLVDDTFEITGRGPIICGRVLSGELRPGDPVQIMRADRLVADSQLLGIDLVRRAPGADPSLQGLMLDGVAASQVLPGDLVIG